MSDPWSTSQSPEITGSKISWVDSWFADFLCNLLKKNCSLKSDRQKTSSLLNTKIYVSDTCLSTNRSHSVDLRFCGKHRDTAPGLGLWRWATSCSAGFNRIEEQVQTDPKFITLNEKTWCPVHLKIRLVQGNLSRCFQAKIGWFTKCLTEREDFPLSHHEPFFRLSNPANVAKSLLDGNREHLLDEGRKWNL